MTKILKKNDLIQHTEYAPYSYFSIIGIDKNIGIVRVKDLVSNLQHVWAYPSKYLKKIPKLQVSQIKKEVILLSCLRLQFKQKWWKYNHTKKQLPAWGKSYKLYKQLIKKYYVQ